MRIMVNAKSGVVGGSRRGGRACSTSTGNPLEDMANNNKASTPTSRPRATPIAIPDSGRRNGASPRASPSSKLSPSPSSSCSSCTGPFYAGAKFSEAPLASSLPKPPSHWTAHENKDQFQEISNQLKLLLNIKA